MRQIKPGKPIAFGLTSQTSQTGQTSQTFFASVYLNPVQKGF